MNLVNPACDTCHNGFHEGDQYLHLTTRKGAQYSLHPQPCAAALIPILGAQHIAVITGGTYHTH